MIGGILQASRFERLHHVAMRFIVTLLILAGSLLALCQGPPPRDEAAINAMKELAFIVGEWKGEAWYMVGGSKQTTTIEEKILYKAGNTVVSLEGLGKRDGQVVHNAFGILYYDSASKEYRMRSFLEQGTSGEFKATVKDGVIVWTIPSQRTIRYTIKLDSEGRWHEVGEIELSAGKWTQFMEMKLKKVK
jgi:hypothetical protein